MKFKTHQQIDEYYAQQGLDIPKLNKEFEDTKRMLLSGQDRAKSFLKKRMGKFNYWKWKNITCFMIGPFLSYGFGYDGYVEKAKEYGFAVEDKK